MISLYWRRWSCMISTNCLLLICWSPRCGRGRYCLLCLRARPSLSSLTVWRYTWQCTMKPLFVICWKLCCTIIRLLRRARTCSLKSSTTATRKSQYKLANASKKGWNSGKTNPSNRSNWLRSSENRRQSRKYSRRPSLNNLTTKSRRSSSVFSSCVYPLSSTSRTVSKIWKLVWSII